MTLVYETLCLRKLNRQVALGGLFLVAVTLCISFFWQIFIWPHESVQGLHELLFRFKFVLFRCLLCSAVLLPFVLLKRVFLSGSSDAPAAVASSMTLCGKLACMLVAFWASSLCMGAWWFQPLHFRLFYPQPFNLLLVHYFSFFSFLALVQTFRFIVRQQYVLEYPTAARRQEEPQLGLFAAMKHYCRQEALPVFSQSLSCTLAFSVAYYLFQGWLARVFLFIPALFFNVTMDLSTVFSWMDVALMANFLVASYCIFGLWRLALFVAAFQMSRSYNLLRRDPSQILHILPALESKRPHVRNHAFMEAYESLRLHASQRALLFQDLESNPTAWELLRNACLFHLRAFKACLIESNALLAFLVPKSEYAGLRPNAIEKRAKLLQQTTTTSATTTTTTPYSTEALLFKEASQLAAKPPAVVATAAAAAVGSVFKKRAKKLSELLKDFFVGSEEDGDEDDKARGHGKENKENRKHGMSPFKGLEFAKPSLATFPLASTQSGSEQPLSSLTSELGIPYLFIQCKKILKELPFLRPWLDRLVDHCRGHLFSDQLNTICLAVQTLGLVLCSSYDEDVYGQVQRDLRTILELFVELQGLLEEAEQVPFFCNPLIASSCPEAVIHEAINDNLSKTVHVFSSHISGLDFTPEVRARLARFV